MPRRNPGETNDSAKSVIVITTGAVNNATAYRLLPTRHVSRRDRNSRRPLRPTTSAVKRMPARLGPANIATTADANRASLVGVGSPHRARSADGKKSAAPRDRERKAEIGGDWMPLDERFEPDHDAIRSGGNR
jgi:hypothetical protein